MLLSEIYPGIEWLEKVCYVPLSRIHYPEEFYRIMENGLRECDFREFVQVEKTAFEEGIYSRLNLMEIHVEYLRPVNSYWCCSEQIEMEYYSLYVVRNGRRILWIYLGKTNS